MKARGRGLPARFLDFNKYLSKRFDGLLPEKFHVDGNIHFQEAFAPPHIPDGALVYDVGGGKRPFFSAEEKARRNLSVVGLDIDSKELTSAPTGTYDETVCADIMKYRGRENADVVICQALLEPVSNTEAAFAGLGSILKKDGLALVFAPSRNAVYARINLIIPEKWKRSMLRLLFPELDGILGFPSYYDRCTLAAFEKLARAQGLTVIEKKPYYRSDYFIFFAPLHVLWRLWIVVFRLLARDQAAETFSLALRKEPG